MNWLREAISDGRTDRASAKRIAMLLATLAMSISLVILAAAGYIGNEVAMAMGAVAVPLAGLGGYSYVNGKTAEAKRDAEVK
jgi:hypothetical protein